MAPESLLKWIQSVNPGLNMENWRIHNFRNEPSGRRLILYVEWDSADTKMLEGLSVIPLFHAFYCLSSYMWSSL
jgi:hypothetical protein